MEVTLNIAEMGTAIREYGKARGYDVGTITFQYKPDKTNKFSCTFEAAFSLPKVILGPKIEENPLEKPAEPAPAAMPKLDVD